MNAMTASADAHFSKADVEHLVRELVPPIVDQTVERAMARIQQSLAAEIAKGMTEAIIEHNLRIGIDTTTAQGIREAHRRNSYVDEWMAGMPAIERRWAEVDRLLVEIGPDDRQWLRRARMRAEKDGNTLREAIIRWAVPIFAAALASFGLNRLIEGKAPSPTAVVAPTVIEHRSDAGEAPVGGR